MGQPNTRKRKLCGAAAVGLIFLSSHAQADTSNAEHSFSRELEQRLGKPALPSAFATRSLNSLGRALIKEFEGWIAASYNDPAGYCTIGYGHLIAKQRCEALTLPERFVAPLTLAAGEALLLDDLVGTRSSVTKLVVTEINDNQYAALVSFAFNVGSEALAKSKLLALVNIGDMEGAEKQFGRWIVSNKKVYKGLVDRRACEASVFNGSTKLSTSGKFDRTLCAVPGMAPDMGDLIDIDLGE